MILCFSPTLLTVMQHTNYRMWSTLFVSSCRSTRTMTKYDFNITIFIFQGPQGPQGSPGPRVSVKPHDRISS